MINTPDLTSATSKGLSLLMTIIQHGYNLLALPLCGSFGHQHHHIQKIAFSLYLSFPQMNSMQLKTGSEEYVLPTDVSDFSIS